MKNEKFRNELQNALEQIDDELNEEVIAQRLKNACETPQRAKTLRFRVLLAAAIVALVVAAVMIPLAVMMNKAPEPTTEPPVVTNTTESKTEKQTTSNEVPIKPTDEPTVPTETKQTVEYAALLYIDVNPSVYLCVQDDLSVSGAFGVNPDGDDLLRGVRVEDMYAKDAVRVLVGSCADKGYLTDEKNAVLLTVTGDDPVFASVLCAHAERAANSAVKERIADGIVVAQTLEMSEQIKELCRNNMLTPGKAVYILNILALTDKYTVKDLASMSFSELQRIAAESGIPDEKIGVDAAIRVAAERFAGEYYPASDWSMLYDTMPDPTDPNITIRTLQFSNKTDSSVQSPTVVQIYVVENAQVEETAATGYTVNFKNGERIYQYLIDKYTGEILRELSFDADLTEENVAQPAYAYLGVSKEDVKRTKVISRRLDDDTFLVYLERQDGRTFCVIFIADGAYYTSCVIPDVPFPEDN